MNTNTFVRFFFALLVLVALAGLSACDNAVEDDHHDHADAHGLRVTLNGVNIYQVQEGQVSCTNEPCGITVAAGEETALISLSFLDHDGDVIGESHIADDHFSLGYEFGTEGVAEFEQHAEDGKWRFHIHGESVGETKLQLKLMHGDHADFTTPPVSSENAIRVTVIG